MRMDRYGAGWTRAALVVALAGAATGCGGCNGKDSAAGGSGGGGVSPKGGFVEVAERAGLRFTMNFLPGEQGAHFKINLYDHGCGVAIDDIDGDGLEDVFLANQLGSNGMFRNRGDGTFEDVTARSGVGLADRICTSAAFADYDGDGDADLFVATTRGGNALFRNDGTGRFADVTQAAGVALVAHTQGATFFDYDLDGDLDLFVANTAQWTLETRNTEGNYFEGPLDLVQLLRAAPEANVLYRNKGDGTFEDVTAEAGVAGNGWGGDFAVFDVDDDGDQDVFVANMFGSSAFYRNDGKGHFEDLAPSVLEKPSWGAVACKPMDYDVDGRLDLLVVDMHSDMWMSGDTPLSEIEETKRYAGPEGRQVALGMASDDDVRDIRLLLGVTDATRFAFGNTLFRNEGGWRFRDLSQQCGAETFWPWGTAVADFDLDGSEDVFIPSGMGYPFPAWRNVLLMNDGRGNFAMRAKDCGIDPRPGGPMLPDPIAGQPASRSSRAAAVIDYDADGRPDLVVNNFNERAYLYHNEFAQRHWLALRLRGTRSNRDAVGAVARVKVGDRTLIRQVCSAGGYLSQSTRTLYFGLADANAPLTAEITWPGGRKQTVEGLAPDKLHEIVEAQ